MKPLKNIYLLLFFVGFPFILLSQPKRTHKIFSQESKILVISGHPDLEKSNANKIILEKLEQHYGNQISIRLLDKLYPDYQIDINAEQEAIKNADFIILQFPFYWYSTPAILKKWIDDVLYDYFPGNKLSDEFKDKVLIASVTIGGSEKDILRHTKRWKLILFLYKKLLKSLAHNGFLLCIHLVLFPPTKNYRKLLKSIL